MAAIVNIYTYGVVGKMSVKGSTSMCNTNCTSVANRTEFELIFHQLRNDLHLLS